VFSVCLGNVSSVVVDAQDWQEASKHDVCGL